MENVNAAVQTPIQRTTKLLSIGRMWDNADTARGNQPVMRILLDRNLGLNITLQPSSQLIIFPNTKREGKKDADYRVAVELPTATVDAEIARQRTSRVAATV